MGILQKKHGIYFAIFGVIIAITFSIALSHISKALSGTTALTDKGLTMRAGTDVVWSDTFIKQFMDYSYPIASPQQGFTLQRNSSNGFIDIDKLSITCNGVAMPSTFINQRTGQDVTSLLSATDHFNLTLYLDDLIMIHTAPCAGNQVVHINVHEDDEVGVGPIVSPYTQASINYTSGSTTPVDTSMDGNISAIDSSGSKPVFTELWHPSTGHETSNTYIYVSNDADYYYLTADITGDDTNETRGEDYWKVNVLNGKTYKVTDQASADGVCGFTMTSKVSYPHATCEMKIPKSDIPSSKLAFTMLYYGTLGGGLVESDIPVSMTKSSSAASGIAMPGQVVTYTIDVNKLMVPDPTTQYLIYTTFTDTLSPYLTNPTNLTYSTGCQPGNGSGFNGSTLMINTLSTGVGIGSCTITYDATVSPTVLAGTKIDNLVTATSVRNPAQSLTASAPTLTVGIAHVFDPPSAFKTVDASKLPIMTWKMVWINDGNTSALNTQVIDSVPAGTTYVAGSLICTPKGASVTTTCTYDAAQNRVRWEGNIAPDAGGTTEANSPNAVVITFSTSVPASMNSVQNQAMAYYDENGNGSFADEVAAGQTAILTRDPGLASGGATVWRRVLASTGQDISIISAFSGLIIAISIILAIESKRRLHQSSR